VTPSPHGIPSHTTTTETPPKLPKLKASTSSDIMFHTVRKLESGPIDFKKEIPLEDVFLCSEWKEVLPPGKYVLTKMTMREFIEDKDNLVLSYRWKNKIKVTCGGNAPGSSVPLPVKPRELAVDFIRALPYIKKFMWVDFLCHLNVDGHLQVILNTMGELYTRAMVFPLYLLDFATAGKDDDDGDDDSKKEPTDSNESTEEDQPTKDLLVAIRRGWIQQEVSNGRILKTVVETFVKFCLSHNKHSVLATFLRRRPEAMKWLVQTWKDTKVEGENEFMQQWRRDFNLANDRASLHDLSQYSALTFQAAENHVGDMLGFGGVPSPPGSLKLRNSVILDICKEMSPEMIDSLITTASESQRYLKDDLYSAVRLLRSFSESSLYMESDVFVATLQCAARAACLKWIGGSSMASRIVQTQILRECWRTVFKARRKGIMKFRCGRTDPMALGLGLFLVLPECIKDKSKRKNLAHCTFYIRDVDTFVMFYFKKDYITDCVYIAHDMKGAHNMKGADKKRCIDMTLDTVESFFALGLPSSSTSTASPPQPRSNKSSSQGHGCLN